jgi:tRNA-specific 2-thiouridylase
VQDLLGDAARAGDWAWLRLTVDGTRVREASGEGPGVAELCAATRGLSLLEAAALPGETLACEALANAIGPHVRAPLEERRVAVALSGGVDSAVALLAVRDAGLEPVGVTLRLWLDPHGPHAERACCSPESVLAARRLCHGLGVPHVTLDLRETFKRRIVDAFVAGYARGETPNPCVACNGELRFDALLACADRLGARLLATGHYARIAQRDGRLLLRRAADEAKDQSYMLGRVDPELLPRLWFPLGEQTKAHTRERAAAAGLAVASRSESQEACFLAGADYREFLGRHGLSASPGPVLDLAGRQIGSHVGFWRFTPGQRRGLGVGGTDERLYAVATDPGRNAVVAGPRQALARRTIDVAPARLYAPASRAAAKLRYRSPAIPARVEKLEDALRLHLDEPAYGVAAGQAAVLYEDDLVVGAGLIARAA